MFEKRNQKPVCMKIVIISVIILCIDIKIYGTLECLRVIGQFSECINAIEYYTSRANEN